MTPIHGLEDAEDATSSQDFITQDEDVLAKRSNSKKPLSFVCNPTKQSFTTCTFSRLGLAIK